MPIFTDEDSRGIERNRGSTGGEEVGSTVINGSRLECQRANVPPRRAAGPGLVWAGAYLHYLGGDDSLLGEPVLGGCHTGIVGARRETLGLGSGVI